MLSGKNAPTQNFEDSKENVKTKVNKFKATTLDYYSTTLSKSLEGRAVARRQRAVAMQWFTKGKKKFAITPLKMGQTR